MASLKKIGRYYYGRWRKQVDGKRKEVTKSLGVTYKDMARKKLQKLEQLEQQGEIDPYSQNFDPQKILEGLTQKDTGTAINTVREAADLFYKRKSHLSNASVANKKNRTMNNSGTYERVIEFFIKKNGIADLSPLSVKQHHFERVIFRDVKPATMGFYYRSLRAWWNKLLEWNIVENDYLAVIKKDLPKVKENVFTKMLSESELEQLFNTFDNELAKKRKQKHWHDGLAQYWFRPLIAVYFYCGLRRNEATYNSDLPYSGLKFKDLKFQEKKPAIIRLPATKGDRVRSIPIHHKCQKYLIDYLEIRGALKYDDYIFVYTGTRQKGRPVTGHRAYREFKRYLELANLPKTRTLHGMRHQRITKWIEMGYSPAEAQFMAGHTNMKTTEKYTHLMGMNLLEKQRRLEGD